MEIELFKISSSNSNPRGQNYVQMPYPSSFFFFFLKRENSGNSWVFYFTVPGEWEIWTLRGWGGEFEPEMWVFLEG